MPEQTTGVVQVSPVTTAAGVISTTLPSTLTVTFSGIVDITAVSWVVGQTATTAPPATFAGLSNPDVLPIQDFNSAQYNVPVTGTYSGRAQLILSNGFASFTVGHHGWICLFDAVAPGSGDVPVVVLGPFNIVT